MINKQNLWFITLFALILILGIYYITLPDSAIPTFSADETNLQSTIEVKDSDIIIALKVEEEEKILKEMEDAQKILLDNAATTEEKNAAYETLQQLNYKKGKIDEIEKLIKEKFNINSCVKIEGNKINITLSCEDKGAEFANNIIKEVQSLYNNQMYITIKFQSK
ncbi:MAG: SpoIIIAH-like family protein [bacterium]|nr:SpoIIIAH-like family protein [bacterium]